MNALSEAQGVLPGPHSLILPVAYLDEKLKNERSEDSYILLHFCCLGGLRVLGIWYAAMFTHCGIRRVAGRFSPVVGYQPHTP